MKNKIIRYLLIIFTLVINPHSVLLSEPLNNIDYKIIPKEIADNAIQLRNRTINNDLSIEIVESLTTEVGPRRMGTEGDKRAISWAMQKFEHFVYLSCWLY